MNNPIKSNGNYFIKDSELSKGQDDKFKHEHISENIINLIENESAPFNIAIVGKWGIGKSSLINMVKSHFEGKGSEYIIEDINAWKYEKEALRRTLMKRVLIKLGYKENKFADLFKNYIGKVSKDKMSLKDYWNEWYPLIVIAGLMYVIAILLSVVGQFVLHAFDIREFTVDSWITFILNELLTNFYFPIFLVLLGKFITATSGRHTYKFSTPITSTDEYEQELETTLSSSEYKNKKIIVVVDDLDRLTPNKIVEALDALKAFVGYSNCIFIVPFDDCILKDAIKKGKTNLTNNEHLTIEGDLFLDKLFQYKIFLPNAIQSNLPEYAIDITKVHAKDLVQLCGEESFELLCKEILIHTGVTTPRQAKKIMNSFSNNLQLGYRRELSGDNRVEKDTFTSLEGVKMLAKISVLQSDFSTFYSDMFNYIDIIAEFLGLDIAINELPVQFLPYYDKEEMQADDSKPKYKLNPTGENLRNFLQRTSSINSDNMERFLYMDDDYMSIMFGNEFNRSIRNALESGSYDIVKTKIIEKTDTDLTPLLYDVLLYSIGSNSQRCLIGLINLYPLYSSVNTNKLINLVDTKLKNAFIDYKDKTIINIDFGNLIKIYEKYSKEGIDYLIRLVLTNTDRKKSDDYSLFFENEAIFSDKAKNFVRKYISENTGIKGASISVTDIFNLDTIDIEQNFEKYFDDLDLFTRLVEYIVENESYTTDINERNAMLEMYRQHFEHNTGEQATKTMLKHLTSEPFCEIVIDIINDNLAKLKDKTLLNNIALNFVSTEAPELYPQINIYLCGVDWQIQTGQPELFDEYIANNLSDERINIILNKIVENKQIPLLTETIKVINTSVNEIIIGVETFTNIVKQYDDVQKNELFNNIYTAVIEVTVSEVMLARMSEILKKLSSFTENHTSLNVFATNLFATIKSSPTTMGAQINLLRSCKESLLSAKVTEIIAWCNSYISSYSIACIRLLDIFSESILETQLPTIVKNITTYSDENSLPITLKILKKLKKMFKSSSTELTLYKDFLISNLEYISVRKEVFSDIENGFSSIGSVGEYILKAINYSDCTDLVIRTSIKFLGDKNQETVLKTILEKNSINEYKTLHEIFSKSLGEVYLDAIIALIDTASKDNPISYIFNLFKFVCDNSLTIDISHKVNLAKLLLDVSDDSWLENTLNLIDEFDSITSIKIKNQLGFALFTAFKKTQSELLKGKICNSVKITKTTNSFLKDDTKTKRDFSDEENMIIKKYKIK